MTSWAQPAHDNGLPNLGRLRVFANPDAPQDERWLVLHDSFGEWLSLIMPAFAGTSCFLHNPDFDEIFVRKFKPTRVFFIQIERFFIRVPLNGVDYAELFAEQSRLKGVATPEIPPEIMARLFSPTPRSNSPTSLQKPVRPDQTVLLRGIGSLLGGIARAVKGYASRLRLGL